MLRRGLTWLSYLCCFDKCLHSLVSGKSAVIDNLKISSDDDSFFVAPHRVSKDRKSYLADIFARLTAEFLASYAQVGLGLQIDVHSIENVQLVGVNWMPPSTMSMISSMILSGKEPVYTVIIHVRADVEETVTLIDAQGNMIDPKQSFPRLYDSWRNGKTPIDPSRTDLEAEEFARSDDSIRVMRTPEGEHTMAFLPAKNGLLFADGVKRVKPRYLSYIGKVKARWFHSKVPHIIMDGDNTDDTPLTWKLCDINFGSFCHQQGMTLPAR